MKLMTKTKNIRKTLNIIVIIIAVSFFLFIAFDCIYIFGWTKKTVNNLKQSDQQQIISAYGLELHNDEYISSLTFLSYGFEKYYVIKINNIDNVKTWASNYSSWVVEDFDKRPMIFDNKRYANQRIYLSDECVYVSVLSENNSQISSIFTKLYSYS